jgi:hypothetical protein
MLSFSPGFTTTTGIALMVVSITHHLSAALVSTRTTS